MAINKNTLTYLILTACLTFGSGCERETATQATEFNVQIMLFGSHPLLLKVKDGVIDGVRKTASDKKFSFTLNDANFQFQEAVQQARQITRHGK